MDYREAANFLFGLRRYPPGEGIATTTDLLAHLDDPRLDLVCVQVAGSNGKGTTARMVESVLREAGLSVGLYTSPHLEDVRERIRVDGRPVSKRAVSAFVERTREYVTDRGAAGESPTFFETLTALALWEFDRRDVDIAVLEVGIGGRYDATSVVDPAASAVTTVALEHTDLLGDTIPEIARDKAQIAPDEGPLVTATTGEALAAVRDVADRVVTVGGSGSSPDSDADDDPDVTVAYAGPTDGIRATVTIDGDGWGVEARLPFPGAHFAENAGVAATLARAVAADSRVAVDGLETDALARGIAGARWPGRFEVTARDPLVVLDGAHNPGGCGALAATLAEFEYERLHLVFGTMVDKDHPGMAAALPDPDTVWTCRPARDRAEHHDTLAAVFENAGAGEVSAVGSVAGALDRALEVAGPEDCVLVAGSLYAVAEARRRWTSLPVQRRVGDLADARETLAGADVTPEGAWRMRGKAVHRVLRARVQPRQASYLKEELLSLGGECAISGVRDDEETLDVVMMGTMAQFRRLADKLEAQPYGLAQLGERTRASLGIGTGGDARAAIREHLSVGASADTSGSPASPGRDWPWTDRTAVMGILNVTPDSFHDGGEYDSVPGVRERARRLVEAGVDVLDVGGESTRPGADPVPVEAEIRRVVPAIEAIREAGLDVPVSIDTRKAAVASEALDAGADIVNDVSGLEDPDLPGVAAEHDAGLVVMHSVSTPVDPERRVEYDDVVADVLEDLRERVLRAERAGLDRRNILVDPGVGFGKTPGESFELLDRVDEFRSLGCPVLVGHSHKSMFGLIECGPDERLAPTIAATALAADRGADVIRVHDGPENVAAVRTALAASDPGRFFDGD